MTVQGNENFISRGRLGPPFSFFCRKYLGGVSFRRKIMRGSAPDRRSRPSPCWARGMAERAYLIGMISRMGKRRPSSVIRVKRVPLWTIRSQRVLPVTKVVQATPSSFNS